MPDYSLPGQEHAPLPALSLSYVLAGAIGVVVIGFSIILGKKLLARGDEDAPPAEILERSRQQGSTAAHVAGAPSPTRSARHSIVRHAAASFARLLEELLANEAIAAKRGLLQRIDPRAKVIGLLGLLVIATLVHHPVTLALSYGLCLLLAALSAIPPRRLLRVWLVIPLFSAAIMLPALLNVVTPGHTVLTLWQLAAPHFGRWRLPPTLTITDGGIFVALRFILRTAVCVTLALLLTASTRSHRLFRGLRALGVPMLFVMLLSMMERYLTVFVRAAEEIHLAKISRSISATGTRREQAWVAAGMGALFRRTQAMGSAVHLAMVSRGYTGEIYALDEPRWQVTDWAFLLIAAGFAAVMLMVG